MFQLQSGYHANLIKKTISLSEKWHKPNDILAFKLNTQSDLILSSKFFHLGKEKNEV